MTTSESSDRQSRDDDTREVADTTTSASATASSSSSSKGNGDCVAESSASASARAGGEQKADHDSARQVSRDGDCEARASSKASARTGGAPSGKVDEERQPARSPVTPAGGPLNRNNKQEEDTEQTESAPDLVRLRQRADDPDDQVSANAFLDWSMAKWTFLVTSENTIGLESPPEVNVNGDEVLSARRSFTRFKGGLVASYRIADSVGVSANVSRVYAGEAVGVTDAVGLSTYVVWDPVHPAVGGTYPPAAGGEGAGYRDRRYAVVWPAVVVPGILVRGLKGPTRLFN